jgi:hypothetical protein
MRAVTRENEIGERFLASRKVLRKNYSARCAYATNKHEACLKKELVVSGI